MSQDICRCGHLELSHDHQGACWAISQLGHCSCERFDLAFHSNVYTGTVTPSDTEIDKAIDESGLI